MKNAIILHGYATKKDSFWFPWLKEKLEEKGFTVWLPQLPNTEKTDIKEQLPFVLENGHFDTETILIGHSAGVPLSLAVVENLKTPIKQAILVAGFIEDLDDGEGPNNILQEKYDWENIKKNCKDFIFINSDNDPWKCDDKMGRKMADDTGGKLIVLKGEGHMGSDTYKQSYKEFPLLLKLI